MIEFQGIDGIEFWPPHEVASIMPEYRNWWRGVRSDGRVAHRPTPPLPGPWSALGNGFANARWLKRVGKAWEDPGGFALPTGELPPPPPEPESPLIPELGMTASQVYALSKVVKKQEVIWHTDQGAIHWRKTKLGDAAALHPDLFLLRQNEYLNRKRLRQIRASQMRYRIFALDDGREYVLSAMSTDSTAPRLGLTSLVLLEPSCPGRFGEYQLRDWPMDLSKAPTEFLRKNFSSPRHLIGNLVWQRLRYRQTGILKRWGDSYRGFWYAVLVQTLYRAGFLDAEDLTREVSLEPHRGKLSRAEALFRLTYEIVGWFVSGCGFFDFHEFGFSDPAPELFKLGLLRPEVVLVTEKDDNLEFASKLVREFGVSHYHLGRQPSLLRSEYVAERLLRVRKTIWVIAYVDYDAGGWALGRASAHQLEARGLQVGGFDYLLKQECFTEEEKRLHSHPCKMGSKTHRVMAERWRDLGGGLDGQLRGIYANYVEPYPRVRELFLRSLNNFRPVGVAGELPG